MEMGYIAKQQGKTQSAQISISGIMLCVPEAVVEGLEGSLLCSWQGSDMDNNILIYEEVKTKPRKRPFVDHPGVYGELNAELAGFLEDLSIQQRAHSTASNP